MSLRNIIESESAKAYFKRQPAPPSVQIGSLLTPLGFIQLDDTVDGYPVWREKTATVDGIDYGIDVVYKTNYRYFSVESWKQAGTTYLVIYRNTTGHLESLLQTVEEGRSVLSNRIAADRESRRYG